MLLVPGRKSSDINNINEYSELQRKIIIYTNTSDINIKNNLSGFSLINISVQNGDVGGIQDNSELLYSVNMYYGTINNPIYYDQNFKPQINRDAEVRIHNYGFSYKMIDKFKDIENTKNYINQLVTNDYINFKNKSEWRRESEIIPSDPRFYNLDHQILVTDDDGGYYTNSGAEIGMDTFAREYGGIGYRLSELFDNNTRVYVSKVDICDPYKMLKKNNDMLNYINKTICKIQNYGLLALTSSYTIILDEELGYNILNMKRMFNKMERQYERFEIADFMETIRLSHEELKESGFKIRMTIIYNENSTFVSILPLNINEVSGVKESISDIKMYDCMIDNINEI